MTEQKLREKIYDIMSRVLDDTFFPCTRDIIINRMADALLVARIGDVSEWKHQAEVLRLALSKSVLDENAIFDDDVCRYILSNTKLTEEYYIEQAEKELEEEGKDDDEMS